MKQIFDIFPTGVFGVETQDYASTAPHHTSSLIPKLKIHYKKKIRFEDIEDFKRNMMAQVHFSREISANKNLLEYMLNAFFIQVLINTDSVTIFSKHHISSGKGGGVNIF